MINIKKTNDEKPISDIKLNTPQTQDIKQQPKDLNQYLNQIINNLQVQINNLRITRNEPIDENLKENNNLSNNSKAFGTDTGLAENSQDNFVNKVKQAFQLFVNLTRFIKKKKASRKSLKPWENLFEEDDLEDYMEPHSKHSKYSY